MYICLILIFYFVCTTLSYPFNILQLIYDGCGHIVKWIFVTDGTVLPDELTTSGLDNMLFLKTETGCLSSIVVRNAMIAVKR